LQEKIDDKAEALLEKAMEKGLGGHAGILCMLLSRAWARTVEFDLPSIKTAADAPAASHAVLAACSCGEISPAEGEMIMAMIKTHVQIIEAKDLEARLSALERKQKK
jgi:hypothetical protein